MTVGISSLAAAIAAAGMVLSQPTSSTIASRQWPDTASSIESAMVSREGSEARMPSEPMAMPSVTAIVLNSIGVPPPSITPARTCWARLRRVRLHGDTSDQVCTTATSGLAMAASSSPVARNMARAGARAGPCLIALLLTELVFLEVTSKSQGRKTKNPAPFRERGSGFVPGTVWLFATRTRTPLLLGR